MLVYYHKGALAMYALRDAIGEQQLNAALARFLARAALGEPQYTTTAELLAALRPALPEGSEHLIADLFENITLFDNSIAAATFTARADRRFLVPAYLRAPRMP